MLQLLEPTQETHTLPALDQNLLMHVRVLAKTGYTMIFHPYQKGIMVHDDKDVNITVTKAALLQGLEG